MSQAALALATCDELRARLNLGREKCEVLDDGQPPAACGEVFYAIHPDSWRGMSTENLVEQFDVAVTLTMRCSRFPDDRRGRRLWAEAKIGVESRMRAIIGVVHGNDAIVNEANKLISDDKFGIIEPLRFADSTIAPPRKVGAEWFRASPGQGSDKDVGLVQTVVFRRAQRVQMIGDMS